ncbi:hypothetical protein SCHPADRAFT_924825 [Schizopora paradoxa]|uniref:Uncharacterized protein n=1 Tax=Schizopora paradoxa TaxID=27342 RepID=A0A0H2S410_9AGAM|nr:hypothetical protein SCHPADRAFT_924825 [Schizopora paradoxa]
MENNYQNYVGQLGLQGWAPMAPIPMPVGNIPVPGPNIQREQQREHARHSARVQREHDLASAKRLKLVKSQQGPSCPYKKYLQKDKRDELEDAASHFIDTAAIGDMAQVVDGLKDSDGFLGNFSDWMRDLLPHFRVPLDDNFKENIDDIRLAKEKLKNFKRISDQFQKLSKCMEATCAVAEERLKAAQLRIGVASLPNELLANILSLAISSHEAVNRRETSGDIVSFRKSLLSSINLSHVCIRFRRVVLLSPQLWNKISDDMTPDMIKLCLLRRAGMHLDISLTSFANNRDFPKFYSPKYFTRFVSKTSSWWKSLTIASTSLIGLSDPGVTLKDLNLPMLTDLNITSSLDRRRLELGVLRGWNTPLLHSLAIFHYIPPPSQQSANLRCLHISLGKSILTRARGFAIDVQAFRDFLGTCTSLTELHVSVGNAQIVDTSRTTSRISLTKVEAVSFDIQLCNPTAVKVLLEELRFPAASKLDLILGLSPDRSQGQLLALNMGPFFKDENIFPVVTTLKLHVQCIHAAMRFNTGASGNISIPFILIGNIRHLTLSVTGFNKVVPPKDDVPPLRSLTLEKCDGGIDRSWLLDVVEKLEHRRNFGELEELSISGCTRLEDFKLECRTIPQGTLLKYLFANIHQHIPALGALPTFRDPLSTTCLNLFSQDLEGQPLFWSNEDAEWDDEFL